MGPRRLGPPKGGGRYKDLHLNSRVVGSIFTTVVAVAAWRGSGLRRVEELERGIRIGIGMSQAWQREPCCAEECLAVCHGVCLAALIAKSLASPTGLKELSPFKNQG